MLKAFPMEVLMGTVFGFLSGLGIGGGSLLILWLTLVLRMDQTIVRGINLLFFLPAAAIACFFRSRQGTLNIRKLMSVIIAGCIGAILGNALGTALDAALLKKSLGILLLFTSVRELTWKP